MATSKKPAAKSTKAAPAKKPVAAPAKKPAAAPAKPGGARFVTDKPFTWLAASPDGTTLATAHEGPMVTLWSADGAVLRTVKAGGGGMMTVRRPAFSPDGAVVAVGATELKLFEVATGVARPAPAAPAKSELNGISWSKDGLIVSYLGRKEWVLIRYDVAGAKELGRWAWPRAEGMPLGGWFEGTVAHLPTSGKAELVRLELTTGERKAVALPEPLEPRIVPTSAGLWVAFTGRDWALLDPKSYAVKRKVQPPRTPRAFAIDPEGKTLAVGFGDNSGEWLELFDLAKGASVKRFEHSRTAIEPSPAVVGITFAGDDVVVATKRTLTRFARSGVVKLGPQA
jgi:hypothetical protein